MHPLLQNTQLIAFDLDGTLIDSVPDLTTAVDLMLAQRERPAAGIEKVRRWVGNGSVALIQRALADRDDGDQWVDPDSADFHAAHQAFLRFYGDHEGGATTVYPGVREALQHFHEREIPLALVTNKPIRFVPPILAMLDLEHYFQVVLGGDSRPQKKPHPDPLLWAAQQVDATPARSVMIGDSKTDIAAARAARFGVICVSYGYNHGQPVSIYNPDLVVDSLLELV